MPRHGKLTTMLAKQGKVKYRKGFGSLKGGDGMLGEADFADEFSVGRCVDAGYAQLAAGCVEDGFRVLVEGHPEQWWGSRKFGGARCGMGFEAWAKRYGETVEWAFIERAPDRPFSLDWCVDALNEWLGMDLNCDALRKRAMDLGLCPVEILEIMGTGEQK